MVSAMAGASCVRIVFGRDRIEAARMPGMAFAEAAHRQPRAARGAMGLDRLDRVMRAAGIKAAALAQHGREQQLVGPQQQDEQAFHGADAGAGGGGAELAALAMRSWRADSFACCANRRATSSRTAVFRAVLVAGPFLALTGRARRTMQSSAGSALCRNSSRVTRLIVLRVTARGAKRLATTTPSRAWVSADGSV